MFAFFHLKMAICRNFCGRKCGLWVRGGRKNFGPDQKYPKVFPKKFSWNPPHLGPLQTRKGWKNTDFRPKMAKMQNFLWPEMGVSGAGRPKIFRPGPKIAKSMSKKNSGCWSHFGTLHPDKSQKKTPKRPKMAIFDQIFCQKWSQKVGSYCNWGGLGEHGSEYSVFLSKKIWAPNSKLKSNYEKNRTPPPQKKGPFFFGGGGGSGMK